MECKNKEFLVFPDATTGEIEKARDFVKSKISKDLFHSASKCVSTINNKKINHLKKNDVHDMPGILDE